MTSFNNAIMAYLSAKDDQAEFAKKKMPPSVMEMINELVVKKLGIARTIAKKAPIEVPSLKVLRDSTVDGMRMYLTGRKSQGQALLQMTHAVRDVAYPDSSLKSPKTVRLMADIKKDMEK